MAHNPVVGKRQVDLEQQIPRIAEAADRKQGRGDEVTEDTAPAAPAPAAPQARESAATPKPKSGGGGRLKDLLESKPAQKSAAKPSAGKGSLAERLRR